MQEPNPSGCYEAEIVRELARWGRSYVRAEIALCNDGLFHYALSIRCSDRGLGGPISTRTGGCDTPSAAEDAALREAITYFARDNSHQPPGVQRELGDLRTQLESRFSQPLLL